MVHVRFATLTMTMLSLTATLLLAEEKPAAKEPLQVLKDCIQAAEAGDFARYVDHLSKGEQSLQAGYILLTTRAMSRGVHLGETVTDPEMFLLAKTMRDLVKQHTVPESERKAEHHAAEKVLAQLAGEAPSSLRMAPTANSSPYPHYAPAAPEQRMKFVGVLKDPHDFLVASLAEIARPTNISGERIPKPNALVNVGEYIKSAKDRKWTLYIRGDYAVAMANKPQGPAQANPHTPGVAADPYTTRVAAGPQLHIEFQRIDGQWKITRLLPASAMVPGSLLAGFNRPL